ncbi:hypothetical protein PEX1_029780 [Penicillium expansum]|uniref:F-box domain-containing protein n=1 Tax=Penicillium expansum TaxID=27334 RepID=A0A0A2K2B9_PENEN|nr:hypothetical protein PEX2_102600 [Penicillium expansum]KGO36268.1 hypothetical protein PEX1_029780 [Penicillium expansum]KGO46004.1 hypothetical protein PEXP_016460 [Penicillium expansum]KGO61186.1 hypothetical protein PEX2_102600 [Penicillium expansum]
MLLSMKENPLGIDQVLKTTPTIPPWTRDIYQYLEPKSVTYPIPKVLEPDLLDILPVELLLSIADVLPLEDIYCFSLCNRRLLTIFGSRTKHRSLERKARLSFLHRLEYDHPRYLTCDDCLILHDLNRISEPFGLSYPTHIYPPPLDCLAPASEYKPRECLWMIIHNQSSIWSHYRLRFSHLHLAMRRFYRGPQYGISTDALSFTEVANDFLWGDRVFRPTTLFSVEAQICPNPPSLYLRIQDIMSMGNVRQLIDDGYYCEAEQNYFANLRICKHESKSFWMQDIPLDKYPAHEYFNCDHCNTDCEIELFENRPNGHITIVMTRYINLGAGLSPYDPRWRVNLWSHWEEPEVWKLNLEYVDSSPRHTFEALTDTSLEDLTSRNLSYLEDERYQTTMVRIPGDVPPSWALWNGAAMNL